MFFTVSHTFLYLLDYCLVENINSILNSTVSAHCARYKLRIFLCLNMLIILSFFYCYTQYEVSIFIFSYILHNFSSGYSGLLSHVVCYLCVIILTVNLEFSLFANIVYANKLMRLSNST